ncbi:unnamed protein product [Clonostachys rhizophaga]|uniref:Uncharacterized protein n=1 Tax=Clonostachys rhizophaga TaxID=160324 RepID=A0A9N9W6Q2_9HYPO|nr:unnamed protein product [Clonostachys rhizophaga]
MEANQLPEKGERFYYQPHIFPGMQNVWVNRTDTTVFREENIRCVVNKEKREIKGNIGVEFSFTKGVVLSGSGSTLNY